MRTLSQVQTALVAVVAVTMSMWFFVYTSIRKQKNANTKIWVPPKAQPSLPFMGGPPAPTLKDYRPATYASHEEKLVQEAVQSALMSVGIALFMSFKFQIHVSTFMQVSLVYMFLILYNIHIHIHNSPLVCLSVSLSLWLCCRHFSCLYLCFLAPSCLFFSSLAS